MPAPIGIRFAILNPALASAWSTCPRLELKSSKIDLRQPKLWEDEIKNEFKNYLPRTYPEIVDYKDISLVKRYIKETVIGRILRDEREV